MATHDGGTDRGKPATDQRRLARRSEEWGLSPRQAEVLGLLAAGASNRDIARRIGTTEKTVEAHVTQILRRSSRASRALVIAAFWMSP